MCNASINVTLKRPAAFGVVFVRARGLGFKHRALGTSTGPPEGFGGGFMGFGGFLTGFGCFFFMGFWFFFHGVLGFVTGFWGIFMGF